MKSITLKYLLTTAAAFLLAGSLHAQLALPTLSGTYTIDFDNTVSGVNEGAYAGTGFTTAPATGQLDSDAWAVTGWSNGSLAFGGTQTTANTDYTRGATSAAQTTGGFYAFSGTGITTGVAFGIQPGSNDWEPGTLTLRIQNTSGSILTGLDVGYLLYIRNDQGRSSTFAFSYSSDNTAYSSVPELTILSGTAADTAPVSFVSNSLNTSLSGLSILNNSYFYIRWTSGTNGGSGSRDEFALDNISLSNFAFSSFSDLYWDSNGAADGVGGDGAWDNSITNWNTLASGTATPSAWSPSAAAIFSGSAGNITVDNVAANAGLRFDTGGYALNSGTITLGGFATVTTDDTNTVTTINSRLSGTSGLIKSGSGELILTGNNDFSGNIGIALGTLTVSGSGQLGAAGNDLSFTGGKLKITGSTSLDAGTNLSGQVAIESNSDLVIAGQLLASTLALSGSGVISLEGSGSSSSGNITLAAPATIKLTSAQNFTLTGGITTTQAAGTATISAVSGTLALGGAQRNFDVADGSSNVDLNISASITSLAGGRIQKTGGGTLQLGSNPGFAGGVRLGVSGTSTAIGGTIQVTAKDSLGTGSLQFNSGTLFATTALTGANAIANTLSIGAGQTGDGAVFAGAAMEFSGTTALFKPAATTMQHKIKVDTDVTFTGPLDVSTASGTTGISTGLTFSGTGSIALNNATNGITEAIIIDGPTLNIQGSLSASSVTVNAGTLKGVGPLMALILGDSTGTNDANLEPGGSPGTLNAASLTLNSDAVVKLEINGITAGLFDRIVVSGLMAFGGTLDLTTSYAFLEGDMIDVFDWTSTSGSFATILGTNLGGGLSWDTSSLYTTGVLLVVPEPGTAAMLVAGLGLLAMARRNRRA